MLKAIHAQESRDAAERKARAIVDDLRVAKMNTAADLVERSVSETLTYYAFPDIHWQKIRTNNPLERIMREIRRRTRVVGAFPDGQSCLNLAAARLRYIAGSAWSTKRYMNTRPLYQAEVVQTGVSPDQMCERICTLPVRLHLQVCNLWISERFQQLIRRNIPNKRQAVLVGAGKFSRQPGINHSPNRDENNHRQAFHPFPLGYHGLNRNPFQQAKPRPQNSVKSLHPATALDRQAAMPWVGPGSCRVADTSERLSVSCTPYSTS